MPALPSPPIVLLAWLVSVGGLVGVLLPLLMAHRVAARALSPKLRIPLVAFTAWALAALGLLMENTPSVRPEYRLAFTFVIALGAGGAAALEPRFPRLLRLGALALGFGFYWLRAPATRR